MPQNISARNIENSTFTWPYRIVNGRAIPFAPTRKKGTKNILGLRCAPIATVRIGFVGLGIRGRQAVERFLNIDGTQIVALCDTNAEACAACNELIAASGQPRAAEYIGEEAYRELCSRRDIDLVYICTSWISHAQIALCAIANDKHAAVEVPAAMNLEEIWMLIEVCEEKRRHCIMLENCCYDLFELNTLNMVRNGVFGKVEYGVGAYRHYMPATEEQARRVQQDGFLDWRTEYNRTHQGDVYATHGIGPVAQAMGIHRTDRLKTLVAMHTAAINGRARASQLLGSDCGEYANGDHTITLIGTEKGRMIELQHNTMTPQPYSRMFQLVGTGGMANKYPVEYYCVGSGKTERSVMDALVEKYESPILKQYPEYAKMILEGNDRTGMAYIMDSRIVHCLRHGEPMDIDLYDLAEWCCIGELGHISLVNGNIPVEVPDFVR